MKPVATSSTSVTICSNQTPYSWNGINHSISGSYPFTITGGAANGCDSIATLVLTVNNCSITLNLKIFIEGFYTGNGEMIPILYNNSQSNGDTLITDPNVCDTIIVELHDTIAPYNLLISKSAILYKNGDVSVNFPVSYSGGTYYIAVRHRNAIETWSKVPVLLGISTLFDFIHY